MKKEKEIFGVLGLVITDGVGYRNFILSNFLSEAVDHFKRVVIFSGLPATAYDLEENKQVKLIELPVYVEPFKTWFWRKGKEVAHLQLHKDFFGINDNLKANYSQRKSNRGRATRLLYRITDKFHSENFIQFLEKRQQKSLAKHKVTLQCLKLLENSQPDMLFFTHQRPPYVVSLVYAANKLKIKTGTFIFSWDNLASKGRMAASFGFYLVWSELMKEELLHFYPAVKQKKVEIVGTPQFEPYVLPQYGMEKAVICSNLKLNPQRKIICYSCGDISTSKNDPLYISIIAKAIQQKELVEEVNFIVRTSPAEDESRFQHLIVEYPFIKWNFPKWILSRENHPEPWSQRLPQKQDLVDLRAILNYSDLGINMCSTMSLDFMLFDKPVINPVFGNEENGLYNDQRFLRFAHYEKVVEKKAVKIAKNKSELVAAINFYLQDPEADKENRAALLDLEIGKPLKGTSNRIALALKEFSEA